MNSHLSIDIGGTKVRVVIYSDKLDILEEHLLETRSFFQQRGINDLENMFDGIKKILNKDSFKKIGISFNGAIVNNNIVYNSLLGGKVNIDLKKIAEKYFRFNVLQAYNDVVAMTHAEIKSGVGKTYANFLYVNLGTGIRVAYVENGQIIEGTHGFAGEISPLDIWVEEVNQYIKADYLVSGKGVANLSKLLLDKDLTSKEVFEQNLSEIIEIFSKYLSKFFTQASYFYNPKVIVIGGSLTNSSSKWLDKVQQLYFKQNYTFLLAENIIISQISYPASLGAILN